MERHIKSFCNLIDRIDAGRLWCLPLEILEILCTDVRAICKLFLSQVELLPQFENSLS